MAHLLRSVEVLKPTLGALVIVPESLLHSQTDSPGRAALEERHSVRTVFELDSCTFRGARAHATVIQISPGPTVYQGTPLTVDSTLRPVEVCVTRGGLPVHAMQRARDGVPYVHSTHIRNIALGGLESAWRTKNQAKGRVDGWMILLPRVGLPEPKLIKAVYIPASVQLSDCVIAIGCRSRVDAREVESRLRRSWHDFLALYRGTGARYVTLSRLRAWLGSRNITETSMCKVAPGD